MASDTRRLKIVVDGESTGASQALKSLNSDVQASESKLSRARAALVSFGTKAAFALSTAGVAAGGFGLKTAMGLEQADVAFTNMLGSGAKSQAFLKQLQAFANSTPFEFPDLVSASQKLLAMGFNAKDLIPTLRSVGDAVAAMGGSSEQIDTVVRALGQMQAKGKVSSEELLQMTEVGIPALQILADKFGVSTGEMQKMITKGLVPADKGIRMLVDGLSNGTKNVQGFGGMMAKQSETMAGKWSTFMDTVQMGLGNLVLKAKPAIVGFLSGATVAFDAFFKGLGGASGGGFFGAMGRAALGFGLSVKQAASVAVIAFKGIWDTIKNGAGSGYMDAFGERTGAILTKVGLAIRSTIEGFKNLIGWVKRNADLIGPLGAVVLGMVAAFKVAAIVTKAFSIAIGILNTVLAANPITIVIVALGLLAAAFIIVYKRSETFRNIIDNIAGFVKANFAPTIEFLRTNLVRFGSFLAGTFKPSWDALVKVWRDAILPALGQLRKAFQDNQGQIGTVVKVVGVFIGAVVLAALKLAGLLLPILIKLAGNALVLVINTIKYVITIIGIFVRAIEGTWKALVTLKNFFSTVWSAIKNIMIESTRFIINVFFLMVKAFLDGAAKAFGWMPGIGPKLKKAARDFDDFRGNVNRALSAIKDKKVTVRAEAKFAMTPFSRRPEADGGVLKRFANGSERHVAQIARAGEWRVWAEDETGGEAYIPLSPSKRKRSVQILGAVAKEFGYGLTQAANGLYVKAETVGMPAFRQGVSTFNRNVDAAVAKRAREILMSALSGGQFTPGGRYPPRQYGVLSANTAAAVNFIRRAFGISNIGTLGSRPNVSDHPWGKALDAMIPNWSRPSGIALGNAIASWFINNPRAFGTKYVIWRDRITSGRGWQPYTHPLGPTSNPTLRHMDHVHVSLLKLGAILKRIQSFDSGGLLQPGWTLAHNGTGRAEPVGAGNIIVNVYVQGSIRSDRELTEVIRDELVKLGSRNGGRTGLS